MGSSIGDVRRAIVIGLVVTVFAAAPLPLRAIEPVGGDTGQRAADRHLGRPGRRDLPQPDPERRLSRRRRRAVRRHVLHDLVEAAHVSRDGHPGIQGHGQLADHRPRVAPTVLGPEVQLGPDGRLQVRRLGRRPGLSRRAVVLLPDRHDQRSVHEQRCGHPWPVDRTASDAQEDRLDRSGGVLGRRRKAGVPCVQLRPLGGPEAGQSSPVVQDELGRTGVARRGPGDPRSERAPRRRRSTASRAAGTSSLRSGFALTHTGRMIRMPTVATASRWCCVPDRQHLWALRCEGGLPARQRGDPQL